MKRTRIAASEIFSLPESSSSLDVFLRSYPTSVEASVSDWDGDPSLRIAASKQKEPELSDEDIQGMIQDWKKHAKEHATSAGFRKANRGRGPMDPRRFALQLSEMARLNAKRYGSPSLARLAKKLRWVAAQETGVATKALSKMAGPYGGEGKQPQDNRGMPLLQKPVEQTPFKQKVPQPLQDVEDNREWAPGIPAEYNPNRDQSWSSQESGRTGKKRIVHNTDEDLVTMARDYLQNYQHDNSLSDDDDLIDQVQDPDVFQGWVIDLDSKGRDADPEELDQAWQEAVNELSEGLEGEEELPMAPVRSSKKQKEFHDPNQTQTAPGGDWFNTVINMRENPVMDRYLQHMGDKRAGLSRRAKKEKEDDEVMEAVDQCFDHYVGLMLPAEISELDVQEFVDIEYPGVDSKKVWEGLQKLADPQKRHEENPRDRTNQEASRRKANPPDENPIPGQKGNGKSNGHATPKGEPPQSYPATEQWLNQAPSLWGMFSRAIDHVKKISGEGKVGANHALELVDVVRILIGKMEALEKALPRAAVWRKRQVQQVLDYLDECDELAYEVVDVVKKAGSTSDTQVLQSIRTIYDGFVDILGFPMIKSTKGGPQASRPSRVQMGSPFDHVLTGNRSGFRKLMGQKEICTGCRGRGESREGCCGHCGGSGRAPVDPDGEDVDRKAKAVGRLGSLLLVSVDVGHPKVSGRDRSALASVTKSRVAGSGRPLVFRHSTDLMETLIERGIPYRTASYRHPGYQR